MNSIRLILKPPVPYNLVSTILSHGWINLSPFQYNSKEAVLSRFERIIDLSEPIQIQINQPNKNSVALNLFSEEKLKKEHVNEIKTRVGRILSFDQDNGELLSVARLLNSEVPTYLKQGGGRLLRSSSLYEDVVKTLFTTNASWSFTKQMVHNYVQLSTSSQTFPDPDELYNLTELDFRKLVKCGYRARYLKVIIEYFKDDINRNEFLSNSLMGLGKYGMAHVNVMAGNFSDIPIDSEVRSYFEKEFSIRDDNSIHRRYRDWGPYKFLGYKLERHVKSKNWIGS